MERMVPHAVDGATPDAATLAVATGAAAGPRDAPGTASRDDDAGAARLAAGREALFWERVLAKSGANVVGEVLAGQGTFYEWSHYPPGDAHDPETGSQWYYHAHPKEERPGEHGHFHTFRRRDGRVVHLVAVSADAQGKAVRLFTTNRWVTGEDGAPAAEAARLLAGFDLVLARPSWPVNRWLVALLRFYAPSIEELLRERDAALAAWRDRHPGADAHEDRRLEVTSARPIDLARDVTALERHPAAGRTRHTVVPLPDRRPAVRPR